MDSTKRMVLFVVLFGAFMFVWYRYLMPKPVPVPPGQKTQQAANSEKAPTGSPTQPASAPAVRPPASRPTGGGPVSYDPEGQQVTLQGYEGEAVFTDYGAALRHWRLTNPRFVEKSAGIVRPIDLVQTAPGKGPWPLTISFPDSDFTVPDGAKYRVVKKDETSVRYEWVSKKVRISKTYRLDNKQPMVWLDVEVENLTDQKLQQRMEVNLYSRQDPGASKPGFTNPYPRQATGLCYANEELHRRTFGAIRGEDSGCSAAGCGMGSGEVRQVGEVLWVGSDDRYFLTAVIPLDEDANRRCQITQLGEDLVRIALVLPQKRIAPGQTVHRKFSIYTGTKELDFLDGVTGFAKSPAELDKSIDFGMFAVLCRPMLWLLQKFYGFLGNWGLAIILLTFVAKLLTLYWHQKSMRSMKGMQKLKPEMDKLREKFGEDKQRLNQEMMTLYKRHKVNPLGGCLPMLIQMPIWFALYRTLGNAQELYQSGFVLWITDLTAPDPYYVLPILMGLAFFGQQLITPQPMEGAQAKMMKYFMPAMFTFMMLWLPSGLTLYIFINSLLTMIHQWYMNKSDPAPAPVSKTPSPPSGGDGQRPKRASRAMDNVKASGSDSSDQSKGNRPNKKRRRRKKP
jgi:YidC/Oxa1 family membrane protein insertase